MLQDPWAELEQSHHYHASHWAGYQEDDSVSLVGQDRQEEIEEKDSMSESLIVQVGDSLCERNDKILDTTDSAEAESRDEADNKFESQDDK